MILDSQSIVEEIQAAVASQDVADFDLLRDTATEYAAVCEEVNDRLAECQQLLKQGLRSEAIQVAEREPNLVDMVALLDFPELEQWRQLLKANGMVAPPALRMDVAADLNAAYNDEAPLLSLLKTHRLLALGRAPLASRIQVLRKIRLADIMNPVWTDDLRLLETARHRELQKELESAVQSRSLDRINGLSAELDSAEWVYSPQPQLVTHAKQQQQRLAAALATEEMHRIEQELSNAYTAFDTQAGRAARVRWEGCQQIAGLSGNHPLIQRAAAAIAWLHEEDERQQRADEFAKVVAKLENAIETDSSRSSLERLFHAALRFDEEIPPRLLQRYKERISASEITARRRFILAVTTGIAALMLVAVGVAWYIYDAQREEALVSAAKGLSRLVDDENLVEAQRYYDELYRKDAKLAAQPEIQLEVGRLNGLVSRESNRKKTFEATLNRAIQAGVDEPDRSALNEADKIAKTLDEKSRISEWRRKLTVADRERQRKRDQRFEQEFNRLLTAVEGVEKRIELASHVESTQLNDLFVAIDDLQKSAGSVTPLLVSQVTPLRQRIVGLSRQVDQARTQQQLLNQLTTAVGSADRFKEALEAFISRHGDVVLSAEFRRVVPEMTFCRDLLAWTAVMSDSDCLNPGGLNRRDGAQGAAALVNRAKPLLKEAGNVWLAELYKSSRQPSLEKVANRIENGKPRIESLADYFDQPLIKHVQLLELNSGVKYYLKEGVKPEYGGTGRILINPLTRLEDPQPPERQNLSEGDRRYFGPAPQAKIAAMAEMQDPMHPSPFDVIRSGNWEKGFADLIELIAYEKGIEPPLDPLLKFILLRQVLEVAREGSHCIEEATEPAWNLFNKADVVVTANWLLPKDEVAQRARESAQISLQKITASLSDLRQRAAIKWKKDTEPLPSLPQWVGWLRPLGREWTCESKEPLTVAGELFVQATTNDGPPRWQRIATCDGKVVTWYTTDDGRFLSGRPVFFVPAPREATTPDMAQQ